MSCVRDRKRRNRVKRIKTAAMCLAVFLCAAAFVMTIGARVYLTGLSEETTQLDAQLRELRLRERIAKADYASRNSPYALAVWGEQNGMVYPSATEYVFIQAPTEDLTVYYRAYQTKLDKPNTIWEYFG